MNSLAGIFWLVLAQLQNRFFVEYLPVAAHVRCLKEKEWKKWNSVFLLYSSDILCGIAKFSRGNKNKLRTFQPQKWKKIRTASLNENLLVLIKKECNSKANTHKVLRVIHIFCLHFFYKKCISVGTQPRRNRIANSSEFA